MDLHNLNHRPSRIHRRQFIRSSLAGLAACSLPPVFNASSYASVFNRAAGDLKIADIKRTTVKVPYRPAPQRAMDRELPHWRYSEIFEVTLQSGHVGFGETLLYYTWGVSQDSDVARVRGKNAADVMWDDELGAGLQMALFDAVARAADVPVHRLLGNQVADKTPLSWWNIDMATDDMLSECQEAYRQGYLAYKTKGRPWFDLWNQVETVVKKLPGKFKVDMDFNDTLLDAKRGIPILKELEQYPHIDIYETPIPQGDIAGNQAICKATRVSIAMHYGNPDPLVALRNDICDGFIIGGGASRLIKRGSVCEMADKPFWLQLVGTGITAAWSLHFGAVLSHATWPAVNCHQLYQHQLLKTPLRVKDGFAAIPNGPGLGYELDQEAIARYRVPKPAQRPDPPRLIETTWKDGRAMYTANTGSVNFMLKPGMVGKIPYYERGVQTRLLPNDGTARWKKLYQASRQGPVVYKP